MVPRGKGLGGSAQINYLLHFEGIETDFDNWVRLGATTWSYNNLKFWLHRHKPANNLKEPGFCKAENIFEDVRKLSL
jgi:choline dehydrogenase-like flavoprotein